tara:strand:+ start:370 stop:930 length:561 start_codon:yes stop_codon:yes gene_type:complete
MITYGIIHIMKNKKKVAPNLRRILNRIENIPERIPVDIAKKGGFNLDFYLDECIDTIERVYNMRNLTHFQKKRARDRIFDVYTKLQEYAGVEVDYHRTDERKLVYLEDLRVVESKSPDVRSGGLGYASISNATLTQRVGKTVDHYYNPTKTKPVEPVDDPTWKYVGKETTEEWRERMKKEKETLLK